jgi:hypothetical protein
MPGGALGRGPRDPAFSCRTSSARRIAGAFPFDWAGAHDSCRRSFSTPNPGTMGGGLRCPSDLRTGMGQGLFPLNMVVGASCQLRWSYSMGWLSFGNASRIGVRSAPASDGDHVAEGAASDGAQGAAHVASNGAPFRARTGAGLVAASREAQVAASCAGAETENLSPASDVETFRVTVQGYFPPSVAAVAGHFWNYLRSPACAYLHDTFVCSNHLQRILRAFLAATNLPRTSWRAIAIELGTITEKRREWFKLSKRPGGKPKRVGRVPGASDGPPARSSPHRAPDA